MSFLFFSDRIGFPVLLFFFPVAFRFPLCWFRFLCRSHFLFMFAAIAFLFVRKGVGMQFCYALFYCVMAADCHRGIVVLMNISGSFCAVVGCVVGSDGCCFSTVLSCLVEWGIPLFEWQISVKSPFSYLFTKVIIFFYSCNNYKYILQCKFYCFVM